MRLLAFETTCDETSVCLLDGREILSNIVFSQIDLHRKYSGVVPELASRAHLEKISWVLGTALLKAGYTKPFFAGGRLNGPKIHAVAFSRGPGLPGALLVSRVAAETVSRLIGAKFFGVNHLEGHFLAYEYQGGRVGRRIEFPCIGLIVSGGHTELWLASGYGRYKVLGRTRDDAAGEAFDKVAKLLGLGYPGGPAVERAAMTVKSAGFEFPRPYMEGTFDFSFSGLKTAVAYRLRDTLGQDFQARRTKLSVKDSAKVCLAFEEAVTDTLVKKTAAACKRYGVGRIIVGGGVAANLRLRDKFSALSKAEGYRVGFAEPRYCTDNAAMIALCAMRKMECGRTGGPVDIAPELSVSSWV